MLADHRKRFGMSQSQLAARIGKTKGQISDWENGLYLMSVDTAKAIAVEFGCYIDDLYEWYYDTDE